jgi:hypothetical protein
MMSWACGYSGERRNSYRNLIGKLLGMCPLGERLRSWYNKNQRERLRGSDINETDMGLCLSTDF